MERSCFPLARLLLAASIATALAGCQHKGGPGQQESTGAKSVGLLSYERVDTRSYSVFVNNWDDAQRPVLCELIRNPSEWKAVMHPAPLMNTSTQSFGPPNALFQTQQLLLLAKVMPASTSAEDPIHIRAVTSQDGRVSVDYTWSQSPRSSTFYIKSYFLLAVKKPAAPTQQVQFVENGHTVCSIPSGRLPTSR
jgi:hypothetical protein